MHNYMQVTLNQTLIWSDGESDVTFGHTQNLCSAFTHPKCTHTAVNTHTHTVNTHPEQLVKGTSVVVLKVERVLYIHSPTYNSCRPETRTHNLSITSPTL